MADINCEDCGLPFTTNSLAPNGWCYEDEACLERTVERLRAQLKSATELNARLTKVMSDARPMLEIWERNMPERDIIAAYDQAKAKEGG